MVPIIPLLFFLSDCFGETKNHVNGLISTVDILPSEYNKPCQIKKQVSRSDIAGPLFPLPYAKFLSNDQIPVFVPTDP